MTWASGFALFHFLIDLLVDILDKSMHIVDLKSEILNLSKAWMVWQRPIKSEHPSKYIG